jgi:hypothetical protein
MKIFLLIILIIVSFELMGQSQQDVSFQVFSSKDSTTLGFASIILFQENGKIIDTITDVDGKYKIINPSVETKLWITYSSSLPLCLKLAELKEAPMVFLLEDSVSKATGGMETSKKVLELYTQMEKEKREWKRKK